MGKLPSFDLYAELEVTPGASDDDIKRAYRRLAKRFHPDIGEGSNDQRFKQIAIAFEVLRDPESRARYDKLHATRPTPKPTRTRQEPKRPPSPPTSTWQPRTKDELLDLMIYRIANGPAMTEDDIVIVRQLAISLGMDVSGLSI